MEPAPFFNLVAFAHEQPNLPVEYKHFYPQISKALARAGINCTKKTHSGRGSGARMAQMFGATVDAIRQHGGWNNSALDESYLTEIPGESMMACAGFHGSSDRECTATGCRSARQYQ